MYKMYTIRNIEIDCIYTHNTVHIHSTSLGPNQHRRLSPGIERSQEMAMLRSIDALREQVPPGATREILFSTLEQLAVFFKGPQTCVNMCD